MVTVGNDYRFKASLKFYSHTIEYSVAHVYYNYY